MFEALGLRSRPAFLPYASGGASSASFDQSASSSCGSKSETTWASSAPSAHSEPVQESAGGCCGGPQKAQKSAGGCC